MQHMVLGELVPLLDGACVYTELACDGPDVITAAYYVLNKLCVGLICCCHRGFGTLIGSIGNVQFLSETQGGASGDAV